MRQAITTKYLGPTNHRGSRILVKAQAGRMYVPWDHALDVEANHLAAAKAFACKWGWAQPGTFAKQYRGGSLPDDTGYAFVDVGDPPREVRACGCDVATAPQHEIGCAERTRPQYAGGK